MPKHVPEEIRVEAQNLRDQGKSYRFINAAIGLPKSTMAYWWGKEVADKTKERSKETRKDLDKYIQDYKEARGCQDCRNEGYPGMHPYYVLDADHVRGVKVINLSRASRAKSLKIVKEELAKCDIVCANHHRIRTHKRKEFKKELNADRQKSE